MSRGLIGPRSTLEEVRAVPEVERTVTWNPIHHRDVDEMIKNALIHWDMELMGTEYSLSSNGMKWFGIYILNHPDFPAGKNITVGARSAMDKSMAIGMCAGQRVMVCTNLVMTGEFVEFRKHSGKLSLEELRQMTIRGVEQTSTQMLDFNHWVDQLNTINLHRSDAEALVFRAIENKVLPPSKIPQFVDVYFKGGGLDDYAPTLGGWQGAVTELQRGNSLIGQGVWHRDLNKLLNQATIDIKEYGAITN